MKFSNLVSLVFLFALSANADAPTTLSPDSSVESLLGKHGRTQFAHQLTNRSYAGKSYAWERYASWGRDLLVKGQVDDPPTGPSPSARLSKSYRCVHCHNLVREDVNLRSQEPEAREKLLRGSVASHGEKRDGSIPSLVPGTTFWGAINRTRFYNGTFQKYNSLKIADGSRMNPERIADAVQICSRFCSAGRYPEPWELDSILAALWELELKAKDLDLAPDAMRKVTDALSGSDPKATEEARTLVQNSFLNQALAEVREKPAHFTKNIDVYEGGRTETGEAERGALVFSASCGGCHGADVAAPGVKVLARRAREDSNFYRAPLRGTERLGGLYMPLFTAQRLSARQLADVRAYLTKLKSPD